MKKSELTKGSFMSTGLMREKVQRQVSQLSTFLATTYVLYVKTQNFHWNVTGPRFFTLHELFEKQYLELAEAVDEIAERIRALKGVAPGTMHEFLQLSEIKESREQLSENQMLNTLAEDNEDIANMLAEWIPKAQEDGDEGTADIYIQRLKLHEKNAWMLRSHIAKEQ